MASYTQRLMYAGIAGAAVGIFFITWMLIPSKRWKASNPATNVDGLGTEIDENGNEINSSS